MAILSKPRSNGEHWYDRAGRPVHTVPTSDGKEHRPTRLSDARTMGLFPSVSAIIGVLNKPGLNKWRNQQVALSALRSKPKGKKETDEYYVDRIIDAAFAQVDEAAELGTAIHFQLERVMLSRLKHEATFESDPVILPYVEPLLKWLDEKQIAPAAVEKTFVNPVHGYGGTVDLPYTAPNGRFGILDYKSKKTEAGEPIDPWNEQILQVAAYAAAYWGEDKLSSCWGGNIFISSTEKGRIEVAMYSPALMVRAFRVFTLLCEVWRFFNRFDPRDVLDPSKPATVFPNHVHIVVSGPGGVAPVPEEQKRQKAPGSKLPEVVPPAAPALPPPPAVTAGKTMLELLNAAVCDNVCDGIEFMSPADSAAMPSNVESTYAWYVHAETNRGKVGLRGDAALLAHGWENAFKAFPKDLNQLHASETKAKQTAKVEQAKVVDAKKRIAEIEKMPVTFGKYRGDKKVKCIGDLPLKYLDYLRDCKNVPAIMREYLAFPIIEKRIDRAIK